MPFPRVRRARDNVRYRAGDRYRMVDGSCGHNAKARDPAFCATSRSRFSRQYGPVTDPYCLAIKLEAIGTGEGPLLPRVRATCRFSAAIVRPKRAQGLPEP